VKIALIGYGKMGKEIEQIAISRGHTIVARLNEGDENPEQILKDSAPDVAIEFTIPGAAVKNMKMCFSLNIPIVVGTTGWYDEMKKVISLCTEGNHSLFWASNFSVGVNIFFRVNTHLARLMKNHPQYTISMEEIHHTEKKDAPSGTAITLAEGILAERKEIKSWINEPSDQLLPIISKRENQVPGTHSVSYSSPVDEILIRHTAKNRKGFALGAVLAAEFLPGKKGVFGMEDLLGF
jgi:4-hydroxy-tetrahydrodipicolinate reductase